VSDRDRSPDGIHSSLAGTDHLERLDAFVLGLGERIDLIQEDDRFGRLDDASRRALELATEASDLGLAPLAAAAERVAEVCKRGEPGEAHQEIVDLTDAVRRVRIAHRGPGG
jgi:hypothetical protein